MPQLPRTVFLYGQNSLFGRAYLSPVLNTFPVDAVIIADGARWRISNEAKMGRPLCTTPKRWFLNAKARLRRAAGRLPPRFLYRNVYRMAARHKVPVHCVHDLHGPQSVQLISDLNPELILCAAFPQILRPEVLEIPALGCINFHPSLLPAHRGASPVFWSIARGETLGGITAHYMTPKIDDGNVVAQITIPIGPEMTCGAYYGLIERAAPEIVTKAADFLNAGAGPGTPQDPASASHFCHDRQIHYRVFWSSMGTEQICNLIRTGTAFCEFQGRKLFLRAGRSREGFRLRNGSPAEAGTVVSLEDGGLVVATLDGFVEISTLSYGKRNLSPMKWAYKHHAFVGQKLH